MVLEFLRLLIIQVTSLKVKEITGVISKSSGIISDLNIAKGVLEIGSITKTTGQFIDDVGKPSEIIQKIQDSLLSIRTFMLLSLLCLLVNGKMSYLRTFILQDSKCLVN